MSLFTYYSFEYDLYNKFKPSTTPTAAPTVATTAAEPFVMPRTAHMSELTMSLISVLGFFSSLGIILLIFNYLICKKPKHLYLGVKEEENDNFIQQGRI